MRYFSLLLSLCGPLLCDGLLPSSSVPLSNPVFMVRIKKNAMDASVDAGTKLISYLAPKIPLPNYKMSWNNVHINLQSPRIARFDQPQVDYDLYAPNKFSGSVVLPSLVLQSDFAATRDLLGMNPEIDDGKFVFKAENVQLGVSGKLGQFENGVPKIDSFDCNTTLGPANLDISRAKKRFVKEVMQIIARTIRPIYTTQICRIAKMVVETRLNNMLAQIRNFVQFNSKMAVKYLLKPIIDPAFFEVRLFAKVISDEVSPYDAEPFVQSPDDNDDAMVTVFFSDAMANDILHQAYANKFSAFTVNPHSHQLLYKMISLNCAPDQLACLGNQLPDLPEKYGRDSDVQVKLEATRAPRVQFLDDKASFDSSFSVSLDVTPKNSGEMNHVVTAKVDANGSLRLKVNQGTLYGKAKVEQLDVDIDNPDMKQYEDKIRNTIKKLVENHLNDHILFRGLPLSLPFGIGITTPMVKFSPHTLQIRGGIGHVANGGWSAIGSFLTNHPAPVKWASSEQGRGDASGSDEHPSKPEGTGSDEHPPQPEGSGNGDDAGQAKKDGSSENKGSKGD